MDKIDDTETSVECAKDIRYEVWIKVNENDEIIDVNSNIFINDFTDWIMIDKNVIGDKGAHAQSQYFDKPLVNEDGKYNYKYKSQK